MKSPMLPVLQYIRRIKPEGANAWMQDANLLHRYSQEGDQSAFADLVVRHGPRVLAVCRRVLGNTHDAEDAFQVTFLLLARQAGGLRHPDRLAYWLHGVALRTALKARGRRRRQFTLVDDLVAPCYPDDAVKDLKPLIDESIAALPGRYRDVIILCYLEGLSTAQAAKKIGCLIGTISSRLGRAKLLLQSRLQRRGVVHPGATVIAALPSVLRETLVPYSLFQSTCALGLRLAATSVAVASLAKGVAMQMMVKKISGTILAVAAFAGLGLGTLMVPGQAQESPKRGGSPRAQVATPETAAPVPVVEEEAKPGDVPPNALKATVQERTRNFIVEAPTKRIANLIAKSAEMRRREGLTWLGKEQVDWDQPCSIKVTLTQDDIHNSVSTFDFHQGKVSKARMQITGSVEHLLSSELPHELTHVILAHHFGYQVPRWADEGLAQIAEDDEDAVRTGMTILANPKRIIPLARLMEQKDYGSDLAAFYAQSRSLTAFLLTRMTPARFLEFIRRGTALRFGSMFGWDDACKSYAKFENLAELEKAFLAALKEDVSRVSLKEATRGRSLTGLPPMIVEGEITEGSLRLYFPQVVYKAVSEMAALSDGKYVPVINYLPTTADRIESLKLSDIKAYRGNGQLIPPEDWHPMLAKRRVVFLSLAGVPLKPAHAEALRDDAIILVLSDSQISGLLPKQNVIMESVQNSVIPPPALPPPQLPR